MRVTRMLVLPALGAGALALGVASIGDQEVQARNVPGLVARAAVDSTILSGYRWRNIGPDRGGRSIAVSGVRGRPNEAYFGAVGGGLWKTTDGGQNWAPVTDGQIKSASVGAVAVSETNPDVVFIGMGETCIRGNIMAGDGVYKSTDAGKTFTNMGLQTSEHIGKIIVDPRNSNTVWVASQGPLFSEGGERGLYKTTDGGKTWTAALTISKDTGISDIVLVPPRGVS